jgi:signal transduction histidine kinase
MDARAKPARQAGERFGNLGAFAQALTFLALGLIALGATAIAWHSASSASGEEAERDFSFRGVRVAEEIAERSLDNEQALRGAVGLFAARERVARTEWGRYVEILHLAVAYPGLQSMGFARRVAPEELEAYVQGVRREGLADFTLHPAGARREHVVTEFVEPLEGRNRAALGYDQASDPERRAALEKARDTGRATITAHPARAQDRAGALRPVLVMFMPVYRGAAPPATTAQRRAALLGFVVAPLRLEDLLASVMGNERDLGIELFDGPAESDAARIYRSPQLDGVRVPKYTHLQSIAVANRTWTLKTSSLPAFEKEAADDRPRIILVSGLGITTLLLALLWSVLRTRTEAVQLAGKMTQALRENQDRLGLALSATGVAIFDWDIPSDTVHLSEQWAGIIGGEAGPRTITMPELESLVHPEDVAAVREKVRSLLAGEVELYRIEHRVRTADFGWRTILSQAKVTARDTAGRPSRVTGTNADISALRELERLKNSFIATVSHELRTPLTAILGPLALVKDGETGPLSPDAQAFVDIAFANSERLAALINDILDLEKIDSGAMEFNIGAVDIAQLFERARHLHSGLAAQGDVALAIRAEPGLSVTGDDHRLAQVLGNLLSNALKYSPRGGTVTLAAQRSGNGVRVEVSDEGPGVPEEFRAKIFTRFAQADGTDTRSRGGTGLGLAICKTIVERLGGRIGYEPGPDRGSRFWFTLPATPQ